MAKKKAAKRSGKPLVIVESPAKARTIGRFLGKDYLIEASIGHVRDLPEGAKQVPEKYKKEDWAYLGVNVNDQFEPIYIIPPGKSQQVRKLKGLLKEASELYLATDEDREGEAISWHLRELLQPKVPCKRLVFHEITRDAIEEALSQPRDINDDLVRAQETRRILDRLYGYEVSPLLWRKVRPRLSAGRVQSVAVRLIVDRERERMAFVSAEYYDIVATFATAAGETFQAPLISYQGRRVPSARDFDPATGKLKDDKCLLLDEAAARELAEKLLSATFEVANIDDKPYTSKPYPPFTTSTLQQEANRKLRFTARRTMQAAQSLYENGHITYMRTDSTHLAKEAVAAARDLVASAYGNEYLPDAPRTYQTKVKNAQEAHEAIRPAGHPFEQPDKLRGELSEDEFRVFDLIWKRTIASQMTDARGRRISIEIGGQQAVFQVGGKTIDFPGYLRAYVEGADDPQAELADKETVLPAVEQGQSLSASELDPKRHATQPPARFTEATLTRTLEELGIGRPSTYAAIIETILAREYVFKRGNALVPTWTALAVARLMEGHLPELIDYQFTAQMEDDLDAISRGEAGQVDYLNDFYFGKAGKGLKAQLADKVDEIDARDISQILIGEAPVPDETKPEPLYVRVGRYGPFVQHGDRRASLPDGVAPDEMTVEAALELLEKASAGDEPLGTDPDTGKAIFLKVGRFGPYVQLGDTEEEDKPKRASLLKGMEADDVTLEVAIALLSLPRDLGNDPKSNEPVMAFNGRYGPYIKCGDETRSLPADVSPLTVTLEQSLELLAQPKQRRRFGEPKVIRDLDTSPVTGEKVRVLEGRYGPYVSDGTTNASVPKDTAPDALTHAQALDLLAARAARGPSKRKAKRKTAKKKTTKAAKAKKTTKKAKSKATKRKTAKKKSSADGAAD